MRKNQSARKNIVYNFLLNIINILFPLITSPYVSKVLGADNLGKYNFSYSFASWFLVFATFGTTTYGIREISRVKDNKILLNKVFSEIFCINMIATAVTLSVYICVIFTSSKTNTEIMLFTVSSLSILLNLFCIDWLYMGLEYFGIITLRSLLIKIICLVSIFIFIKEKNDYVIYALINVIAFGSANILNFIRSRKYVSLSLTNIDIKQHLRKISVFFYSNVVVSIYTLFDQVFLGLYSTNKDVAFYSRSRQIYSIALSVTLSISNVLLPKLSYLFKNDIKKYKVILKKSINYIYFFSVPFTFAIMILSKDIMWVFGGNEFEKAYISLLILSILIFVVSLGTWQYNQLFLPLNMEKVALKGQLLMAICSVCGNFILVGKFGYIGASISLVFSEVIGTSYNVLYCKRRIRKVKVRYITISLIKYTSASLIIITLIGIFKSFNFGHIFNIAFTMFIGSVLYILILYMFKDNILLEFVNYVLKKYNHKID